MSNAFEQLLREADKPTQVPEQLAKYVAALVNGTHEITSVAIRPKREWRGLTDEEIDELSRTMVKGNKSVNWLCRAIEAKLREKNA